MRFTPPLSYRTRIGMLICMLLFAGGVFAQPGKYVFRHLTQENGLLNAHINTVFQDHKGYIWIGTNNGLQRFDGYRYNNYLVNLADSESLQYSYVQSVFEDSKGRFWVGAYSPYILDRATGKFYNYNLHRKENSPAVISATGITEDGTGNIWLVGLNGYFRLNPLTNQFEDRSYLTDLKAGAKPTFLDRDSEGKIWMVTTGSICCYDPVSGTLFNHSNNPLNLGLFNTKAIVTSFCISGNYAWLGYAHSRKVFRYNLTHDSLDVYDIAVTDENKRHSRNADFDIPISTFRKAAGGSVIISIGGEGIALYNNATGRFDETLIDNNDITGLHSDVEFFSESVNYQDHENNIWVGSNKGLNIFNPLKKHFYSYGSNDPEKKDEGPAYATQGFVQLPGDSDFYVAYGYATGGLARFSKEMKLKEKYLLTKNGSTNTGENQLWTIFAENAETIWASNQVKSLLKLNTKTGVVKEVVDSSLLAHIGTIEKDKSGNIWLATLKTGLKKIDAVTHKVYTYPPPAFTTASLPFQVFTMFIESDSVIWVGSNSYGLLKFDTGLGRFTEAYSRKDNDNKSISNNSVALIIACGPDSLILATRLGIDFFNKRTGEFSMMTGRDGLPGNIIQSIELDENRNLWVACDGGFCKVNLASRAVTRYGIEDGITDNLFNNAAFLKLHDGRYMVPCSKGFMVFRPSDITSEPAPQTPVITGIRVFDEYIHSDSLLDAGLPLELSYKQNSFSIEFASLQFNTPGQLTYYYQLTNADQDWVRCDADQSARYNQLSPGNYVFRVKCVNRDGLVSKTISTIKIIIQPPFWQRWWFRLLALLLVSTIIYMLYRYRMNTQKAIQEERIKVEKLNAEQYKSRLEMEQVINYFTTSLVDKHSVDDVLWDVARNLIGRLGFVDCMIYLWNEDETKMIQKAGYGPKGSLDEIQKQPFDVEAGQGVVGYVMQHKTPVIIPDTSADPRYRVDEMVRGSEITVPIIYNDELIGIIDSEHHEKHFFTEKHLQILITIAALMETKIHDIQAEQSLRKAQKEKAEMQYESLKQHLNPHFLFNSLAAVIGLIKTEPKLAVEFIRNLNRVYRYILQNKDEELVSLQAELDFAQQYFQLQKIRFGNGLEIRIEVGEGMLWKKIVPVTLQNLIENAIKHNIIDDENPLRITLFTEDNYLVVQNNLQKKTFVETSNRQGLNNLKMLYGYISERALEIKAEADLFTVKIPLL